MTIFFIIFYILLCVSLYFLFPKLNIPAYKAWIPGVNFVEWAKVIGRKPTYALWLLFPIVNLFVFVGMSIDMVRSFGKESFLDAVYASVLTPFSFLQLAKNEKMSFLGPIVTQENNFQKELKTAFKNKDEYTLKKLQEKNPYKKTILREWTESIIFAVFAASFIRMFLIEAYVIPTPSMEGSLNVGDFLFVSKAHYGIRMPMTIAMVPLVHNRMPFLNKESYLKKPSLPYRRLPAIEKVEAGKPFVFNWPVGDSVYITSSRSYFVNQIDPSMANNLQDRELANLIKNKEFVVRPIDKKDHYIKRCVAGPNDSLRIIDRQIYLNGKPMKNPKHLQFLYEIVLPNNLTISKKKLDQWGIDEGDLPYGMNTFFNGNRGYLYLDADQVKKIKDFDNGIIVNVYQHNNDPSSLFPNDTIVGSQDWTIDNYGPIWIPAAGATTPLTLENLPFYRRIIEVYENNTLELKNGKIFINGEESNSYTFKQDYYWAMGDNRHNSEDSRTWGYVPFDHVVGKPLFIFFSTKQANIRKGINWNRIFKSANSD